MFFSKKYKHKFITLGDSLTQGFQSGAIYRTDLSYPAFIAKALGIKKFKQANFTAQTGLPINVELLIRSIEEEFGTSISWSDSISLINYVLNTLFRIRKYWEGKKAPLSTKHLRQPFHNQSLFSVTVQDIDHLSAKVCAKIMEKEKHESNYFKLLAQNAFYVAGRKVINPDFDLIGREKTLFSNVKWFSDNGGIENLIVYIGSNNIVGTITNLKFILAEESDLIRQPFERTATIYPPDLFRKAYLKLATQLNQLHIKHIYTATLPVVTQAPLLKKICYRDEDFYTFVWIKNHDFDPTSHPHLTVDEVETINEYVQAYNEIILETAASLGWSVLRMDKIVTNLNPQTRTMNHDDLFPTDLVKALRSNPMAHHLLNNKNEVILNTNYIKVNPETGKLCDGGIFSLDGIHPTTIAYGLIADGFMRKMQHRGVEFQSELDWDYIVGEDHLSLNPPLLLGDFEQMMSFFNTDYTSKLSKLGADLLKEMLSLIGGGR